MKTQQTDKEAVRGRQGGGGFPELTPERVLTLVERGLGVSCSNLCRPLNSYINRVYELQARDGSGLIVKFYRPGRWSHQALQDEHDFLLELAELEIPVVAPLAFVDGTTLAQHENSMFAVFPKKGGRSFDEYNDDQWLELGHLLGRTHAVGAKRLPRERIIWSPDHATRSQRDFLLQAGLLPADLRGQFADLTGELIDTIAPLFNGVEMIRIHGDCHFSNLIYRPGESFYIIDFDDMAVGPPVQDLWMLLPGHLKESPVEVDIFLEGYETFRPFDRRSLGLIEPLRAMRYIHFMAWCGYQLAEDGLARVVEDFGSRAYWQREMHELVDQLTLIRSGDELPVWGNM